MPVAKVTSKGQITIPLKVRKELGLDAGSYMVFEPIGSSYKISPLEIDPLNDLPKLFSYDGPMKSLAEMDEAIADAATETGLRGLK